MWRAIHRWMGHLFGDEGPTIELADSVAKTEGVVIEVPFGDARLDGEADARLCGPLDPERVGRIISFAARRKLPVDTWLIRHLWSVPARPEALARWLVRLERKGSTARLRVDARGMPERFRRRLVGNLRRFGHQVSRRPTSARRPCARRGRSYDGTDSPPEAPIRESLEAPDGRTHHRK